MAQLSVRLMTALLGAFIGIAPLKAASPSEAAKSARAGDITQPAAGSSDNSGAQLSATTSGNQASLKLAGPLLETYHWSLLASSPLSQGSSSDGGSSATNTNLATLDGLANGATLKLQLSYFTISDEEIGNQRSSDIEQLAHQTCEATPGKTKAACNQEHAKDHSGFLQSYLSAQDYREYLRIHFPGHAALFGLQGGFGYNSFTYFDPATLTKLSANKMPYSGKVFLGYMPDPTTPFIATASLEYQHAFKSATAETKCLNASTPTLKCASGAFTAPIASEKYLTSLNLRYVDTLWGHAVGAAPVFTYDLKSRIYGIDLPVYFISDAKGNPTAGIDVGWTSNTHVFTIGIMIGAPFSLL